MSVALVFPGQGSEEPGMGLALAAIDPRARRLLELASEGVGIDLARAIERGARAMTRTEVIQPALVAVGLAAARALLDRIGVDAVLGHSLGELTAAAIAIDLDDEGAIELACARGRAMAEAAAARPGGMLAIPGGAVPDGLVLAAESSPDERVVSGDLDAIARAERAIPGSRRLAVAGAWHSPAIAPAVPPFRAAIDRRIVGPVLQRTLISAVHARAVVAHEIPGALAEGLVRPVRFVEALRALGPCDLVAIAPSRVVRSLARRTLGREANIHTLDGPADLETIARALG